MYTAEWTESEDQPAGDKRIRLKLVLYRDDKEVAREQRSFLDVTEEELETLADDKIIEFEAADAAYIANKETLESAQAAAPTREQIKDKIKDKLGKKLKKKSL